MICCKHECVKEFMVVINPFLLGCMGLMIVMYIS